MIRHFTFIASAVLAGFVGICSAAPAQEAPRTLTVQRGDIIHRLAERGSLEAVRKADLSCPLHNRTKQGFATTIKWVVEDGTAVKKGDKLLEFDDGHLREAIQEQEMVLAEQKAGLVDEELDIKLAMIGARREALAAESNLELATLDQVAAGKQFALMKRQLEAQVKKAELALKLARLQTEKKNDVESKLAIEIAEVEHELAVLELKRTAEGEAGQKRRFERTLEAARLELEGVKLLNERRKRQTDARLAAAKAAVAKESAKLWSLAFEAEKCIVNAPMDGMVVYHVPEQARFGPAQAVVAVGEPVREGQKLLRICDLAAMQVMLRVPEAQISWVRVGQAAKIRVDAFPDREFTGKVTQVATVAESRDWRTADVKVYGVVVSVDEQNIGLKPGMTAAVDILLREAKNVLRVPMSALKYEANGRRPVCHVQTDQGPEKRNVTVGIHDGRFAEIKDGLKEGEQLVRNPKTVEK